MESYIDNWRRMFDEEDLDGIISEKALNIVRLFKSDINPGAGLPGIDDYRDGLVCGVWSDMLAACQDASVPVTAFDREKFWTALKSRGCTQRNLTRNRRRILLRLENGVYSFDMKINLIEVESMSHSRFNSWPGAKITTLGEEGAADFIFMFDRVIPRIREGIDGGYVEMANAFRAEKLRHERIRRMVDIMMQGRGIDYRCDIEGDRISLKFQKIVFTKLEKDVREDQLEEFLSTVPELMETAAPRVTEGERIEEFGSAFFYRDDVYMGLKERQDGNGK